MTGDGSPLPDSWVSAVLSEFAEVRLGRQRSPKRATGDHMRPYMRAANVTWDGISLHDVKEMDFTPKEFQTFALQRGDILLAEASGSAEQVGKPAVWNGEVPNCCFQNTLIRVRAGSELVRFLHWHFFKDARTGEFAKSSRGVGIHHLGAKAMELWRVVLPPVNEQHRIVSAIETHFSKLDAAEAALKRVQANLKRYRASVLKAAVEGRLVPTEAELARQEGREYEPASVLLSEIKPPPRPSRYKSRSKDIIEGHASLAVGNPGTELPEGWAWSPLLDIARLESGHTPSKRHPEWWEGDIPWIGIPDAREHNGGIVHDTRKHTNDEGLANSAARLLPPNTVCLSRTASVGYVLVTGRPMATSQDFVNWICTAAIDPLYLRLVLLADKDALLRFGKGTVHTTIYFPEVLSIHVGVPPLAEQKRIVAEVEKHLSRTVALANLANTNHLRCQRLRQSILKWAFEGKLVDQDPNDEPASVLLERIRAEREAAQPTKRKPGRKPGRRPRKKKS